MAFAQGRQLFDEPTFEHRVETCGDRFVQSRAIERDQRQRNRLAERRRFASSLQRRQRLAGHAEHFERPLDALRVGCLDARSSRGIDPREIVVKRGPAAQASFLVDLRTHDRIGAGKGREAFGERLEVQHRAAGDDRHATAPTDAVDGLACVVREPRSGIRRRGIDEVEQMMRPTGPCRGIRLRRADVHAAIDLRGIHGHDLAVEAFRELERERALAGGRRPHQQDRGTHRVTK